MRSRERFTIVALMFCLMFLVSSSQAQFRASLRGVVTDPQGAVLPGATVTLLNTDTNAKLTATSDENGIYVFNALPPAHFKITVEHSGFKKKVFEHVQIIPEQLNAFNVQLEVGEVQESVTVSGTTQALDTETATVGGTISSNQVQNFPSFGRDVFQLIQLAPGVFGNGAQGGGGGGANLPGTQGPGATGGNQGIFQTENGPQALAAGQQYENNSISIDGISTTSAVWGGTTIITPSEESVQNVKVVSNSYDAENGRFSGAQIQVNSKSGGNQYHGTAFFTAHRPGLNAYQRWNGENSNVLRDPNFFSQFGGSVGGPIWKDKIFGFFAYETVRSPAAQTDVSNGWYETPSFAASAPAGSIAQQYLTFPGSSVVSTGMNPKTCADIGLTEGVNCNTIPGQGLDVGSPLTTGLGTHDLSWTSSGQNPGVGNGLDGVADIANYITASTTHYSKAQYNGRVDANITNKDQLAFALYWVPQSSSFLNGPARAYNFFNHSQVNQATSLIWNHTFSPTFLNEARVNAAGWRWNEITSNPQSPVGLPSDSIWNIGNAGISSFGPNVGSILNQWTFTYKDVATKVIGRHTIKFGGDLTRLYYLNQCVGCGVPSYSFFNLWDFLNDAPRSESAAYDPHTGAPTTFRQDDRENIWGFFIQDDFKLRKNLSINMGLRWSYFGPLYAKQNNMYRANPGAGAAYLTDLTVTKGNSWNSEKGNFGPQIGFAWSPERFDNKLVVRGGYGLNFNQEEIAISANINANPGLLVWSGLGIAQPTDPNPGIVYATSTDVHSFTGYPPNPNFVVSFGPNGLPTTGQSSVSIFPSTLPTMRVHHYSLDAQYELGHNYFASLGYMGSLSHNIYFHANPNAAPAALGYALNPQIGGGDYWGVSGHGNYNAMLAELRHPFSKGLSFNAQFTWAKSMDTSSGPYFEQPYAYNVDLNYGRSDYNVGKAFKLFGTWSPTIFHGNDWKEKVIGGWSLSGIFNIHSGFPWSPIVNLQGGNLYCGTCWGYNALFPAAYLGGAGSSTSNDAFKTGSNYPNGGLAYFSGPAYTTYSSNNYGAANPPAPGIRRNSLTGPGYKSVDMTLIKSFGLPTTRVLGENAKIDFRMDVYNLFNNLNIDPGSIDNNLGTVDQLGNPVSSNSHFGVATSALGARVVTLGARFNF